MSHLKNSSFLTVEAHARNPQISCMAPRHPQVRRPAPTATREERCTTGRKGSRRLGPRGPNLQTGGLGPAWRLGSQGPNRRLTEPWRRSGPWGPNCLPTPCTGSCLQGIGASSSLATSLPTKVEAKKIPCSYVDFFVDDRDLHCLMIDKQLCRR